MKTLRRPPVVWLYLLWLLLPALACTAGADATRAPAVPPSAPTATSLPFAGEPALPPDAVREPLSAFAPYVEPDVTQRRSDTSYSLRLDSLSNPELLGRLTAAEQLLLSQRGFVLRPALATQPYEIYEEALGSGAPLFITVDAVLATGSSLFRAVKVRTELASLDPILIETNHRMALQSLSQYRALPEGQTQEAAWRNLAFFSLAARLQNPAFRPADPVSEIVGDEVTLIEGRAGTFVSPLFGDAHDYGAYARLAAGPALARAWLETHPLQLTGETAGDRATARQLLLMGHALATSGQGEAWMRYTATRAFLQGAHPADLSLQDIGTSARAVYGGWPDPAALADVGLLDDFIATLGQAGDMTAFRWLARPMTPDADLFPRLLFNQVGVYAGTSSERPFTGFETEIGVVRGVPHGLDMAAAWKAPAAERWLAEGEDDQYEGFAAQLAAVQQTVSDHQPWEWTTTLSGGWLYALEALTAPPAEVAGLPFAAEPAWQSRLLSSWVGGWAFVHLPPGLGTLPAEEAPAEPLPTPDDVLGYVEGYTLLYARLAALTSQLRLGLAERKMLDDEMAASLTRYEALLIDLAAATARQAATPKAIAPEDTVLFETWSDSLQKVLQFANGRTAPSLVTLATVYENPNTGYELQLGLGEAWRLYAIVPINGRPTLAVGLAFSLSQLREPINQGWDQDAWSVSLDRPEPGPWMGAYWSP